MTIKQPNNFMVSFKESYKKGKTFSKKKQKMSKISMNKCTKNKNKYRSLNRQSKKKEQNAYY